MRYIIAFVAGVLVVLFAMALHNSEPEPVKRPVISSQVSPCCEQ